MQLRKRTKVFLFISIIAIIVTGFFGYNINNKLPENLVDYKIFDAPNIPFIKKQKNDVVKILVIDGGGIRGIVPLHILRYIEQTTGQPIYKQFDLICGSSTGGLIAVGLTIPDKKNPEKPRLSAADILSLYNNNIRFEASFFKKILTLGGFSSPLYDGEEIKQEIWQVVREEPLFSELLTNVAIPAYSLFQSIPVIFESWRKKEITNAPDYKALDVAIAAASAVPYLPPTRLVSVDGSYSDILIDPITILPNPGMLALVEAMKLYPDSKYVILSLGTGIVPYKWEQFSENSRLGKFGWILSSYGITTSGLHWAQNQELETLFNDDPSRFLQYSRININMNPEDHMHALSTESSNLLKMNHYGEEMLRQNKPQIDTFIKKWLIIK